MQLAMVGEIAATNILRVSRTCFVITQEQSMPLPLQVVRVLYIWDWAALGIGPGDEVILADTNWIASAAPITYLGAKPVFVDILTDTWCIDPELAEQAITPKTKAILAVHLYGNMCDMKQLLEIGHRHNFPVIEDAAEAIGSKWQGKHAGTMGMFGTFSFHGTKTMTTGEGGILVTNDKEFYEHVLTLSNHGRSHRQTRQFWPDLIGFKYKLSNIQAAIGLCSDGTDK